MKQTLNRRECVALVASACATLALRPRLASAQPNDTVITRPIPSTGERLPIIGLGSAANFWGFDGLDGDAVRAVMQVMIESGGTVLDTAPDYLAAEEVAARLANELGIRDQLFWATKLPAFRGGSSVPTFLYRVAHNAALTWRRAERGRDARERQALGELARQPAAGEARDEIDEARRLERLYDAIRGLPPVDRSLLLLSLDGVSYSDMADVHGISLNLVGVRLSRARRQLATQLPEE